MKCAGCDKDIGRESKAYSMNYQEKGQKFYGSMWCDVCGSEVMKIVNDYKVNPKKVKGEAHGNH